MNVAIVMPLAEQRGGAERLLQLLLERTGRARSGPLTFELAFLSDGPMVAEAQALGHQATVMPAGRLRQFRSYERTVRALRAWLIGRRPDVVVSWMPKAHLYVSPAAEGLGIPRVWYQHGIPSGGWLDRLATALPAEGVLACSATSAAAQRRLRPRRRTVVLNPAVARWEPSADRGAARRSLGVSADQFVVLLVSRLERWKGVHVAVEGAAEILARHPEVLFVRIGPAHALDAGYATELMGAVSEAHLRPHWQWVGPLPPTEIPRWLQAADVFLHPNVGPEPFGMAVVEAMAAGLPVVASGLGGPAEVIRDGVDGILVPPGDPAALARGIVDLLDKPAERARLGRAAQARAAAFSADAYPERLLQALVALAPSLLGTSAPPGESGSRPEPTA